jgi:hypothetical protein
LHKLQFGHHPDLIAEVPSLHRENNGSFRKHISFATEEVGRLIASGRVEVVQERPHCILPLHVVVQPHRKRLILDCTLLNKFIRVPKIKYDDYKVALSYFRSKGYIFTFDFKDGYYHIKIHPSFKKFLGFSLLIEGKKVFCQFKVGFLGLADLPWLFTKICRVLVRHWRSHAMQICLYLDDGWYFSSDLVKFRQDSRHVRSDLLKAGVVWSVKKCFWGPNREVDWLGMT